MAIVAGAEKVLVASATASAASVINITTGIDSTYDEYEVHFIGLRFSVDSINVWVQLSSDGLVVPTLIGADGGDTALSSYTLTEGLKFYTNAGSDTWITYNTAPAYRPGNAAGETMSGVFRMYNPSATGIKRKTTGLFVFTTAAGNIKFGSHFVAYDNTTDAIDSFRLWIESGTVTGEVRVYGISKTV